MAYDRHVKAKERAVMLGFKHGKLHSGSKQGSPVQPHAQAVAVAMQEAHMSKKKKKKGY